MKIYYTAYLISKSDCTFCIRQLSFNFKASKVLIQHKGMTVHYMLSSSKGEGVKDQRFMLLSTPDPGCQILPRVLNGSKAGMALGEPGEGDPGISGMVLGPASVHVKSSPPGAAAADGAVLQMEPPVCQFDMVVLSEEMSQRPWDACKRSNRMVN